MSRIENVSWNRLPRGNCLFEGLCRGARDYRVAASSSLYNAAQGVSEAPQAANGFKFTRGDCCRLSSPKKKRRRWKRLRVKLAALDSTGFESHHVSQYFLRRSGYLDGKHSISRRRRYPKLWLIAQCSTHLILGLSAGRGPTDDDRGLIPTISRAVRRIKIGTLAADAGFDSERNHCLVRKTFGISLVMPAIRARFNKSLPSGHYRRKMADLFRRGTPRAYRQRWQIETVASMMKRNLTTFLSARKYHQQNKQLALISITHNLAICA